MEKVKTTVLKGFAEYARKAAAEGIVLLKNNDTVLPLKREDNVAVFGRSQIDYYKSGTGSGGAVHVEYSVNALDGFKNNETIQINEDLAKVYEQFVIDNPFDNGGGGWAAEPWFQKEMNVTDEILELATKSSNKAIVIIGRTAGEDKDNSGVEGSYYLTKEELDMVHKVTSSFDHVIAILNVANVIDMEWTIHDNIKAVLYSWQGGMEGGNALADVLSGDVTPSGKLASTIPYKLDDYPTTKNFGDKLQNRYEEDIYLGYRYFETFDKEAVLYPFGYGLSYTSFDIETLSSKRCSNSVILTVRVTNTGSVKGKEVVEVYYQAPQGKLGKPAMELGTFAKTKSLLPNESVDLVLEVKDEVIASYDDSGITGKKSCYVLEAGTYNVYVGNSVRTNKNVFSFTIEELQVVSQLEEIMAPVVDFKRLRPGKKLANGNYEVSRETVPKQTVDYEKRIQDRLPKDISYTGDMGIKLKDVKDGKHTIEEFVAQLTKEELAIIVRGEGMSSPKVTPGTAAAFGGLSDSLLEKGIPVACAADGPSGIRMDTGGKATQLPIGTLLACTWNIPMMLKLYTMEGEELVLNNVDTLLGPGINIHRHPLNGRNFEYFSEDPLITGKFAAAATKGMSLSGSSGTLKHYACNDQESERFHVDAAVSERALREIHLKGFEHAVRDGNAESIMTAYNPINGIWSPSNYDLNTTVLRKEWGYKGMVMTDWWAHMNHPVTGGKPSRKYTSYMVRAQNDLFMVLENFGSEKNINGDDLLESLENGSLKIGELQRSVINILNFILRAPVISRDIVKVKAMGIEPLDSKSLDTSMTSNNIELYTKVDKEVFFNVESRNRYHVVVEMKNDMSSRAQSACNLLINDKYVTNITLNGTNGAIKEEQVYELHLKEGVYKLKLEFTKPGLEINTIKLIK